MVWGTFFHFCLFGRGGGGLKLFGQCPYIEPTHFKRDFPYIPWEVILSYCIWGMKLRSLKSTDEDASASHSLGSPTELTNCTHCGDESIKAFQAQTGLSKKETLRCKCTVHRKSFESIALGNRNRKSLKISPQAT